MKTLAVMCIAAALVAGAASAQTPAPAAFDPAATTFVGWVRVTGGEFELYEREVQVQRPFARPCVSGALPRDLQRAAGDLSGQRIELTGQAVPWSDRGTREVLRFEGSRITNPCGGDHVIQATGVRVIG